MPLNAKGEKIKHAMEKEYGAEKGKQVFYASENKGTIKGVTKKKHSMAKRMPKENANNFEIRHGVLGHEEYREKGSKKWHSAFK